MHDTGWMVSSRSGGNGGTCFQARRFSDLVEIRNSKDPAAATIRIRPDDFGEFLEAAKRGEFDDLR